MPQGPRIYNLFPLLAGAVRDWTPHLDRVRAMEFDWVYVNPFHYPGFSGSLYAIKDFYRLHPLLQGDDPAPGDVLLRDFTGEAKGRGLSVMMDLVINHTAKDALLVDEQPDWFTREPGGELASPFAVDPGDPTQKTIWGDLAQIEYGRPDLHKAQVEYWAELVRHYLKLGFRGFRCDAAYQVPAEIWRPVIQAGRAVAPDALFCAETLGCTTEQAIGLKDAGFDYFFNSAKWWDFKADWLLQQYDLYRSIAPTIAFPESHDTERLAAELGGKDPALLEKRYRLHYLFAACFSSGVMMPIGYEYGFSKRLNVVESRPGDWDWEREGAPFDLTDFIAGVNRMKRDLPALNIEGKQKRVTMSSVPILGLLRLGGAHELMADEGAVVLINTDEKASHTIEAGPIVAQSGGKLASFSDVTPGMAAERLEPGRALSLGPLEARVFRGTAPAAAKAKPPSAKESLRKLEALAVNRVTIENVYPEIDSGRHPVKRVVGDLFEVWADIFSDGHDKVRATLKYRTADESDWSETEMTLVDNDRWVGRFPLLRNTRYLYVLEAWVDRFESWRNEVGKKRAANIKVTLELIEGRNLVDLTAERASVEVREKLRAILQQVDRIEDEDGKVQLMLGDELKRLMCAGDVRTNLSRYPRELGITVDRPAAGFAAWYELFPRSASDDPNRHGTFRDVIRKLPYVRDLGFDVLYFTPIHPIGRTNRKGKNNTLVAGPDDVGSVYAIGSAEGGHNAVHPQLGTLDDFRDLVKAAHDHGLEIALDFAIQCSPDHPWLKEHPEWFEWRPDGSIRFAENPPKKYEDIVNVHFYGKALPGLWYELRDVILFWCGQGVKTFRVDNPHTKAVPFWEWMIGEVQAQYPETIFLSEAFTRPKMMRKLAKVGFTQSYTYFTWRNHKQELTDYLTELTTTEAKEFFRPNFWPNTPDINPPVLQTGGRPAFISRFVLASTLASVYGMYNGYELCEGTPVPGKEEYLNSEKYELKAWDYDRPGNIRDYIRRVNRIRNENPALHTHLNLKFYNAWNDNILYYGKMTPAKDNFVLVAVNLDSHRAHEADFEVPLWELGLTDTAGVAVDDLLSDTSFEWRGKIQHMRLDPAENPCAIWRIRPLQ
jgi:starch synthase (maltosyl-transferring)